MKNKFRYLLMLLLALVVAGCGTPGFPRRSYDEAKQIRQLEKLLERTNQITQYYLPDASEKEKRTARDTLATLRMALINLNYAQFIARFSVRKQGLDAGTEIAELGLNLATTAVGGAGAKTIFGAISSGVTGSKLAIDKNFFFEKTVPVLITSMNAQRKLALAPILTGLTNGTSIYPLSQALSDIDAYYFAGTFIGALQAIQADAGAKENKAEAKITQIRDAQFVAQAAQERIGAVLDGIAELSDDDAIALEKNPPVKDDEVSQIIQLRDPEKKRETDGEVARQMLKMRAVLSGKRSEPELSTWEAAVKSVQ